jgi:integrase
MVRANPFLQVKGVNADVDRRHLRRDLDPEELGRLLSTVRNSTVTLRGLPPVDRHWLYLVATVTGFRAGELAAMTPDLFDLDTEPATARAAKKTTKNKKGALQPLPDLIVPGLRQYLAGKPRGRPVWDSAWHRGRHSADMLARDLAACQPPIPYKVDGPDGPLFADFHALRHTYVTMLSRIAPLKVAQQAARHHSLTITEKYTHARLDDVAEAVNVLALPFHGDGQVRAELTRDQLEALVCFLWGLVSTLLTPTGSNPSGNQDANGYAS